MDWGLVLMSQGIAPIIDEGAAGQGWGLLVPTTDYPAALRAIQLYRRENRHWRWHWLAPVQERGRPFDWRVSWWSLLLVALYLVSHAPGSNFQARGCMDNFAVRAGEWWRLFTAILLHADIAHLVSNVGFGTLLLGLTMGRFGAGLGLLTTYLAGAGGNLAALVIYPGPHLGVGASGMVMGGLGMLSAQFIGRLRRGAIGRRQVFRAGMAGVMLFALLGLNPETDVVAHLGGFATGLALGGLAAWCPPRWRNPQTDLAAACLFGGLLVFTGWRGFH
jgi:membrane associated rhomboid family serine protease